MFPIYYGKTLPLQPAIKVTLLHTAIAILIRQVPYPVRKGSVHRSPDGNYIFVKHAICGKVLVVEDVTHRCLVDVDDAIDANFLDEKGGQV